MPFNDPETPLDPQTEADLRALAELVIADAVLHCLGHHNLDLEEAEREALARDVEAEVDAMFADADESAPRAEIHGHWDPPTEAERAAWERKYLVHPQPECPCDEGARHRCDAHKFARRFTR